ncbi:MAG: efflux transporter outer membrane subunit [Bacteroidales bacterium]|jgi:NodT family efflux transporter outer membrane factor (OMF) lipoprotein
MYLKDKFKPTISILFTLILILAVNSCKVAQPFKEPKILSQETLFRDSVSKDTSNIANIPWRTLFPDKILDSLIDEAVHNNLDLQIAVARMKKAEAALRQNKSAFFPTLSANASGTAQNNGVLGVPGGYELWGSSSWEVDLWGKLRNNKRASFDLFLKSEAYKRAVQTQLIADVADSYYALLALDAQLKITEKTVELRNSDVETIKLMKENDLVTGADLVQSQANLYSAKVTIPDIKQSIYETENALSVLIGRNPGPIARGTLSEQGISVELKIGAPAQLVANRPDVQEAEYQLRYGYEMTNAARKYFYPSLTVQAAAGLVASDISKMFNPSSVFWSLLGNLVQPVFNQGINRERLKTALADQEENVAAYKQVILRSGEEVSDALYGYQAATEKMKLRTSQVEYLEKSVSYTMELLKYTSTTNYLDVLTSEVGLLSAQLNSINDKLQQLQSVVALYRSLGGGWKE